MAFKPNYDGSRIGQFYLAGGTVETIALYDEIKKTRARDEKRFNFWYNKKNNIEEWVYKLAQKVTKGETSKIKALKRIRFSDGRYSLLKDYAVACFERNLEELGDEER